MSLKDDVLDMKEEIKDIKEESFAYELLKDQRKQNKRLFIILIIVLVMWFATGCYLVYILNDTGVIEETDRSFHHMVKALEDFIQVLHEEADSPQQKQMLKETLQRSMM